MANVRAARDGSFTLFVISFVVFCVSFGAPYWYVSGLRNDGLWVSCITLGEGTKDCRMIIKDNSDPWMRGTQATMTIALFFQFFAFIAYGRWLSRDSGVIRKLGMTADGKMALAFNCVAGVSVACAVIPYGSMFDSRSVSSLSWAFYLAVFSGFFQLFVSAVTLAAVGCYKPEHVSEMEYELQAPIRK